MKKTLALLLAGVIALSATACTSSTSATSSAGPAASGAAEKKLKIGIVQLVEHPALDAAYKGFVDGLAEAGYVDGKNIALDYQNAQNEQANCQTIATKLVDDKSDLILALSLIHI